MTAISLSSYLLLYNQSRAMQSTTLVDGYACFSLAWYTQRKKKGEEQLMCGIGAKLIRICECNGRNDLTVRVQATEKNG